MDDDRKRELIDIAAGLSGRFPLNGFETNSAGAVAAALVTEDGSVYTGICLELACGIGFCAEHSAIAAMLKDRKTKIRSLVAVRFDGVILPPCGRCREMMVQVDLANLEAEIVIEGGEVVTLAELLPHTWSTIK
ncbi:MAG: cytidine deaminase [Clostridiales Family XIII bacterium]|jgi:cytidine deaminase|nr:cytidine deaminase [Clostridiales Family XIII bacterium]